jgi:hypothetical protein
VVTKAETAVVDRVDPDKELPVFFSSDNGGPNPAVLSTNGGHITIENRLQLLEHVMAVGKKAFTVQRFKGLGEMNPNQLWETTMDAEQRTLLQVRVEDQVEADSIFTVLMGDAVDPRRQFIQEKFGSPYLPEKPNFFKSRKTAQEAHEAIRPTRIQREPSLIKKHLNHAQYRLYELIWQRMVASQMAAALFDSTTVEIKAKRPHAKSDYLFRASSSELSFPGFTAIYTEGKDENGDEKKNSLPELAKGDKLALEQ